MKHLYKTSDENLHGISNSYLYVCHVLPSAPRCPSWALASCLQLMIWQVVRITRIKIINLRHNDAPISTHAWQIRFPTFFTLNVVVPIWGNIHIYCFFGIKTSVPKLFTVFSPLFLFWRNTQKEACPPCVCTNLLPMYSQPREHVYPAVAYQRPVLLAALFQL
jgi:hypothetical protein